MTSFKNSRTRFLMLVFAALAFSIGASAAGKRALTVEDLMKFKTIHDAVISEDGRWVAYQLILHFRRSAATNAWPRIFESSKWSWAMASDDGAMLSATTPTKSAGNVNTARKCWSS